MTPQVRELEASDADALRAFLGALPAADRTFFWQDVSDPAVAERLVSDPRRISRCVAGEDGAIVAFASLAGGSEWSSHVAEVVLVVAPSARRGGVGQALARTMLLEAVRAGFRKVTVNIAAPATGAIAMFQQIGFVPEALLRDHLLNPDDGELRDLVVLAHLVDDNHATMVAAGLDSVGE